MSKPPRSRTFAGALLAASMAVLAACTVGPNYVKPDVGAPAAFSSEAQPGSSGAALSQVTAQSGDLSTWWNVFNDAELSALVKRAMAGNLQLAEAVTRVQQARAQEVVAGAAGLPSVNATGIGLRQNSNANASGGIASLAGGGAAASGSAAGAQAAAGSAGAAQSSAGATGPSHINYLSVGADATWQIDVFGGTRRSVEAARAQTAQAVWQVRDTQVTIAAEVAQDYLQLRLGQARVKVLQTDLARQQGLLKIVRDRFNAGFVTALDVNQQLAQIAQTEAQIPQVQAQDLGYIHAIAVLLGALPETMETELSAPGALPPVPPTLPTGLPSDLLRRRPDIRASERSLAAANAQIGVAVARFYPSFNLIGQGGFSSNSPSNLFDLKNASSLGLLYTSFNLFNAGQTAAQVRSAKAARQQAFYEYRRTVITGLQEAEDALARYAADQQRWTALTGSFNAANTAFTISNQQYAAGLTDFTNVYQTQGTLLSLQDQLTQADAQLAVDVVAIYKALGGGWSDAAPG